MHVNEVNKQKVNRCIQKMNLEAFTLQSIPPSGILGVRKYDGGIEVSIVFEKKTDKSYDKALEDLKAALTERKFGVLWEMNFKDKLQEKGLDFNQNFKVLEVCNPGKAKVVLDRHLEAGYMLPCKMVVYEKEDGVRIGMMKPTRLAGIMEGIELDDVAKEVEEILAAAIEAAI